MNTLNDTEATIAQWLAQETACRAAMIGKTGVATHAQTAGKTGLALMQAMLRGDVPYPHIADTMDFCLIDIAPGIATFQGTPQTMHLNPMGGTHGGWYATTLDCSPRLRGSHRHGCRAGVHHGGAECEHCSRCD